MICGHCKEPGTTIAHVKACSGHSTTGPAPAAPPRGPVTEDGIYHLGGKIYKVQTSPTSGHRYAKLFRPPASPGERAVFTYWPSAITWLSASDRLTTEEAAKYGALYGTCIVCGRTLTDESSIAAGIGPVCAGKV